MTFLFTRKDFDAYLTEPKGLGRSRLGDYIERAARAAFSFIQSAYPTGRTITLYCGNGRKGAIGKRLANLLANAGWRVTVCSEVAEARVDKTALLPNYRQLSIEEICDEPRADLQIDALDDEDAAMIDAIASYPPNFAVIALEIPCGVSPDSGFIERSALPAQVTITFQYGCLGQYLEDGPLICRRIVCANIGLPPPKHANRLPKLLPSPDEMNAANSIVAKKSGAHKYENGHVYVFSGGFGKSGAARLSANAALRIGAGLVTIAAPQDALPDIAAQITSLMVRDMRDIESAVSDERINAFCIGPGFGVENAFDFVPKLLHKTAPRSMVLDADALSAFADAPHELFKHLHKACVLTPHEGEFRKLFPDIHAKWRISREISKLEAAKAAASRAGCTVLLKGADTVIANEKGESFVHYAAYERAAPWLATAGAGDVLAGFITGLLARGFSPLSAAGYAAKLHTDCARIAGAGLIAEELASYLPQTLTPAL